MVYFEGDQQSRFSLIMRLQRQAYTKRCIWEENAIVKIWKAILRKLDLFFIDIVE